MPWKLEVDALPKVKSVGEAWQRNSYYGRDASVELSIRMSLVGMLPCAGGTVWFDEWSTWAY